MIIVDYFSELPFPDNQNGIQKVYKFMNKYK